MLQPCSAASLQPQHSCCQARYTVKLDVLLHRIVVYMLMTSIKCVTHSTTSTLACFRGCGAYRADLWDGQSPLQRIHVNDVKDFSDARWVTITLSCTAHTCVPGDHGPSQAHALHS